MARFGSKGKRKQPRTTKYSEEELRERLTEAQYRVTQGGETEAPYSGSLREVEETGTYRCRVCNAALFSSDTKFDPNGAWPAFKAPISDEAVGKQTDWGFGIPRTESVCADCGAHLGHVFPEGQGGTDTRYCINSASLTFEESKEEPSDRLEDEESQD